MALEGAVLRKYLPLGVDWNVVFVGHWLDAATKIHRHAGHGMVEVKTPKSRHHSVRYGLTKAGLAAMGNIP